MNTSSDVWQSTYRSLPSLHTHADIRNASVHLEITVRSAARCIATLAAVIAGLGADLRAQASTPLAPGTRVRVTAPDALAPSPREGNVLALRGDSLVLRLPKGDSLAIAVAQVTRLEVSRNRHRNTLKGLGGG